MSDSVLPARKPAARSPQVTQNNHIVCGKTRQLVNGLLERLLYHGCPSMDFSDQVAAEARIPRDQAEVLCNQYLMSLLRRHTTLRRGVQWALRESDDLGQQMTEEFREERLA